MKILMISSDPAIREDTAAARRIEEYRGLADELYTVVIAGKWNIYAFFRAYYEGRRILQRRGARDFLITAQDPPDRWIIAWLLMRAFRVPLQVQVHTDLMSPHLLAESFKNRVRLRMAQFILPRASCIRVVSERIRRSLVAWDARIAKNISVLPIYVDTGRLSLVNRVEERGVFRFVMTSRLTKEKNIELAVDAFAEVVKKFPQAKLVIVGDGPMRKSLEARALGYDLMQGSVTFTGWEENIALRLRHANCYVLTSNYEGYGRAPVEALAAGVPVIMTDVGIAGDIVRHEETGLVIPVGGSRALISAMERIMEDSNLYQTLSKNGRRAVTGFLSKEAYLKLYKTLWNTCGA